MASSKQNSGSNSEQPDKLTALYRSLGRESSPEHLDDSILKQAQAQLETRDRPQNSSLRTLLNWERIVSVAAVMVLSIYIALDVSVDHSVSTDALMDDSVLSRPAPALILAEPEMAEEAVEAAGSVPEPSELLIQMESSKTATSVQKRESVSQRIFIEAATDVERDDFFVEKIPEPISGAADSKSLSPKAVNPKKISATTANKENNRVQAVGNASEAQDETSELFSPKQITSSFAKEVELQEVLTQEPGAIARDEETSDQSEAELQMRLDDIERIYLNGDVEIASMAYVQLRIDYPENGLPETLEEYLQNQ